MKKGDTFTFRCGPSFSFLKGSSEGLPMVNSPPGTAIILIEAAVPGIVSVKFSNAVTSAAVS